LGDASSIGVGTRPSAARSTGRLSDDRYTDLDKENRRERVSTASVCAHRQVWLYSLTSVSPCKFRCSRAQLRKQPAQFIAGNRKVKCLLAESHLQSRDSHSGLHAIENAPPRRCRAMMCCLLFLFGVLLGWSLVGKSDIAATRQAHSSRFQNRQPSERHRRGLLVKEVSR
jgi:hypothetical protein